MLTPDQAEKLVLEAMPTWPEEDCPLAEAHGRVLRAGIRTDRDLPPFDRATMDGFALRSAEAAGTAAFRVLGVQAAGAPPLDLGPRPGTCVEIMTGAVLPAGADCVVPYEETERTGEAVRLSDGASVRPGQSVHRRGGDHRAGELVVPQGIRLSGREIAVAAACGCAGVRVTRSPRLAVTATGDELVEAEAEPGPQQIRRSNDYALRAALIQSGYPRVERFLLRDRPEEISRALGRILAEHDAVLVSGGISRGRFDFIPGELERLGVRQVFRGVAQRPGKPFWFGVGPRGVPLFALPGNPVSTYTCLRRYVIPALEKASGLPPARPLPAQLAAALEAPGELARFVPVRLSSGAGPERRAEPCPINTSGDFAGLVGTDGFVELAAGRGGFPAGSVVPFWGWV